MGAGGGAGTLSQGEARLEGQELSSLGQAGGELEDGVVPGGSGRPPGGCDGWHRLGLSHGPADARHVPVSGNMTGGLTVESAEAAQGF